jgi:uncharacterized protein (DUF58 family)
VRNLYHRVRDLLTRRIRYKITRGGLLFSFAIAMVGFGAVASANNLLFLIVAAMMATLLVSGLVSRLCLAELHLDFLVPDHVPAGRMVPGRLYVRNEKWFIPSFSIRVDAVRDPGSPVLTSGVYFPLIASGTTLEETVEIRFPKRGRYQQNSFAFSTSFPFGFLEKTARVTLRRETIIYPSIDPQPGFDDLLAGITGEIETHYRGLGRDFYRIRPYEAFESARHVDWKASARTGAIQVREFAREQERIVEIYLDRNIPPDLDPWFEHSVNCCAFLAWRLSSVGASIHFRAGGFQFRQPEDGDIYTILKYLALVYPQRSEAPEPPLDETSFQIVFTTAPRAFRDAGWMHARILSPDVLAVPASGTAATGAASGIQA